MRDRGKGLEQFNGEPCFTDASLELPCKKHHSSSSSSSSYGGGICAFCLRDKLAQLVCPQCGDQRLPNCSCSVYSAYSEPRAGEPQILKRSNSTCVTDVSSRGGFWRFRRLFRKMREKGGLGGNPNESGNGDSKNEMWGPDVMAVQRSRSLSSYRAGGNSGGGPFFYDNEDGGMIHSAARASSVSGGPMMESAKRSCFSESEARMSNYEGRISNFDYERDMMARGIFTMREGYEFSCGEDPKFIDLKLDLPSEIRTEHSVSRNEFYGGFSVCESEMKKCRKSRKGWRWLFKASSNLGKDK